MKKFSLVLVLAITLIALFSPVPSAGASTQSPWPKCGDYTLVTGGAYSDANLFILYGVENNEDIVIFNSFNGWVIYRYTIAFSANYFVTANKPNGITSDTLYLGKDKTADIDSITVELKKDCTAEVKCKPTEYHVYTLLGNYPCNLVTTDYPIPSRFLDREYTGPLCQLPDLEFQWNGKYIVNEVKECGGYQVGGKFYNTSLPELP